MPYSYFQTTGLRPRTFLGYDRDVTYAQGGGRFVDPDNGQTYSWEVYAEVYEFLDNFEFYWASEHEDVTSAINFAYDDTPYLGTSYETGYGLKVYGYSSLGVNDFNNHSDWSQ